MGGCNDLRAALRRLPDCVSILTRLDGRVQHRTGAYDGGLALWFQSSPALMGGCNLDVLAMTVERVLVSILTRLDGRVQLSVCALCATS